MKTFCRLFVWVPIMLSVLWIIPAAAESIDLQPPTILLENMTIVSLAVDAAHIVVDLKVHNPNTEAIVVEGILYGITLNQTPIKYGRIQQEEHLPANRERVVSVPVALAYDEHLPDILAALSRTKSSLYEIGGSVKLKGEKDPIFFYYKGEMLALLASDLDKNRSSATQ